MVLLNIVYLFMQFSDLTKECLFEGVKWNVVLQCWEELLFIETFCQSIAIAATQVNFVMKVQQSV